MYVVFLISLCALPACTLLLYFQQQKKKKKLIQLALKHKPQIDDITYYRLLQNPEGLNDIVKQYTFSTNQIVKLVTKYPDINPIIFFEIMEFLENEQILIKPN